MREIDWIGGWKDDRSSNNSPEMRQWVTIDWHQGIRGNLAVCVACLFLDDGDLKILETHPATGIRNAPNREKQKASEQYR